MTLLLLLASAAALTSPAAAKELGVVYIKNWTGSAAHVWIDEHYQGYVPGGTMKFTVREGFVTPESGRNNQPVEESHGGWSGRDAVPIFILTTDEKQVRTYWTGTLTADDRGEAVCFFGKNREPDELERENAEPIVRGTLTGPPPSTEPENVDADDFSGGYKNDKYSLDLRPNGDARFTGTLQKGDRSYDINAEVVQNSKGTPILKIVASSGNSRIEILAKLTANGDIVLVQGASTVTLISSRFPQPCPGGVVKKLGTGDVQATLRWEGAQDVDLHVVDPFGEEIWFQHKSSRSGGLLDVDDTDGGGPENIFWPDEGAPSGIYHVFVVLYSGNSASWEVVVRAGGTKKVFTGKLRGQGSTAKVHSFEIPKRKPK